jgi:hypothetical protein
MNMTIDESVTVEKYSIRTSASGNTRITFGDSKLRSRRYKMIGQFTDNHGPIIVDFGSTTILFWKREWIMVSKPGEKSCFLVPVESP